MLLDLFLTFFKIGAFTIGGGYAMLPFIERDVVEIKKWLTEEEFIDILAIAESTPGPVAVNTATYVGYKLNGMKGVVSATLGVVLPSFLAIILFISFFWEFRNNTTVISALKGIRVAVVALIASAFINILRKSKLNPLIVSIAIFSAFLILYFKAEAVLIIAGFALLAITVNAYKEKGK
ncbi:MAG: chromate transporter [Tissierellia bacterium]|nr:chromate transporter [Tissierellia bacterium]